MCIEDVCLNGLFTGKPLGANMTRDQFLNCVLDLYVFPKKSFPDCLEVTHVTQILFSTILRMHCLVVVLQALLRGELFITLNTVEI